MVTEHVIKFLADPFVMLLLGIAAHFLKAIIQAKKAGAYDGAWTYWTRHRASSYLAIVCALAGFVGLYSAGRLDALTAFGVGFMANSVGDVLGSRATGRLGG